MFLKYNISIFEFIAIRCEPPLDIENGRFNLTTNETTFGSIIEYNCKFGYKLIGPKTITCLANGQYDALPPKCQGKQRDLLKNKFIIFL